MTLQEILKSQGLSDEQIEKVTGEMKQNKIFTASEENLDIRYKDLYSSTILTNCNNNNIIKYILLIK